MIAIQSSAITAVSYEWLSRRLLIKFRSGGIYTFYRVPPEIYHGLINAPSAGRYYNAYIRGRYAL